MQIIIMMIKNNRAYSFNSWEIDYHANYYYCLFRIMNNGGGAGSGL